MDDEKLTLDEAAILIAKICIELKTSIRTRCKALRIYHTFMSCIGGVEYDPKLLAAACISLSVKASGEKFDLEDIIIEISSLLLLSMNKNYKEFEEIRNSIITTECLITRMIECDLIPTLAHEFLVHYLFDMHLELHALGVWSLLSELCFMIVTDFYLTCKCLRYSAEELAAVTIHAAFFLSGYEIDTYDWCHWKKWHKKLNATPNREAIIEDIYKVCVVTPELETRRQKAVEALELRRNVKIEKE